MHWLCLHSFAAQVSQQSQHITSLPVQGWFIKTATPSSSWQPVQWTSHQMRMFALPNPPPLRNARMLSSAATHPWNSLCHPHPLTRCTTTLHPCCSHIGGPFCHLPHHCCWPVLTVTSTLAHIHHLMPHLASTLNNLITTNCLLLNTVTFLNQPPLLSNLMLPHPLSSSHSNG